MLTSNNIISYYENLITWSCISQDFKPFNYSSFNRHTFSWWHGRRERCSLLALWTWREIQRTLPCHSRQIDGRQPHGDAPHVAAECRLPATRYPRKCIHPHTSRAKIASFTMIIRVFKTQTFWRSAHAHGDLYHNESTTLGAGLIVGFISASPVFHAN